MKNDHLIIDGKMYVTTRRAAEIAGYSADYVGQLCRAGKLERRMINRIWYVENESILKHSEESFKANHTSFKTDDFKNSYEKAISSTFPLLLTSPDGQIMSLPTNSVGSQYVEQSKGQRRSTTAKVWWTSLFTTGVLIMLITITAFGLYTFNRNNPSLSNNLVAQVGGSISDTANQNDGASYLAHVGLVVVPSTGSQATNSKLINTITNSFSDPVQVKESVDANSGIITPVFRTVKGHDYLYVLVPVKTSTSSVTSTSSATSTN